MLKFYNSLSRKIEKFTPLHDKKVGIYVCGPTVYDSSHVGHARTWIFFDWLRRYLVYSGYKIKFVQNITDAGHLVGDAEEGEDKIEKAAKAKGQNPQEIARGYEKEYFQDLSSLNILKPDVNPRATEHIKDIIAFNQVLLKKNSAYEKDGNVYFDVSAFRDYGKLSGRTLVELFSNVRIKPDPLKDDPADFALWLKASPGHLQKWSSPWGEGFPGWHIECSVMSAKYLGQPFDIHGSASEHIFPHHENEIAQSTAYAGKPLAHYFLHAGMLLINGQKMSKSLKNFITIADALKKYDTDTIKLALMATFWRKPFNWEEKALKTARIVKEKLVRQKMASQPIKTGFPTELAEAMDDNLNVPKALALIMKNLSKLSRDDFKVIEEIFGLELKTEMTLTPADKKLIERREAARKKGDYKEADRIRRKLQDKGMIIEDMAAGTRVLTK